MKNNEKKQSIYLYKEQGITIIALIVAVIILVLLASISIGVLNNGLIDHAGSAKDSAEVAGEKEIIKQSVIVATVRNKYNELTESGLQSSLNTNSNGNANIIDADEESYTIKFTDSGRYYEVDNSGKIEPLNSNGEKTLTVQCVNSKGTVLAEKTYTIVKNTYSKKPIEVDEYEVANEGNIQGEITEDKTVRVLYYLKCYDDKTLVFKGLDSSGSVTTDESAIVSYRIGDGTNRCIKQNDIQCVIDIPETYNGKKVTRIANRAFYSTSMIKKVTIGSNVTIFGPQAFQQSSGINAITFKCNPETLMNSIEDHVFGGGANLTKLELVGFEDKYKVEDNIIYSKDGKKLILCASGKKGNFTVPDTVEVIGKGAFNCSRLTNVIISDNVKTISNLAFRAADIKEITIGAGVTTHGGWNTMNASIPTVIINSSTIAASTDNAGRILYQRTTIYVKDSLTIGSYITSNYAEAESDREGYVKYVKKS